MGEHIIAGLADNIPTWLQEGKIREKQSKAEPQQDDQWSCVSSDVKDCDDVELDESTVREIDLVRESDHNKFVSWSEAFSDADDIGNLGDFAILDISDGPPEENFMESNNAEDACDLNDDILNHDINELIKDLDETCG